MTTDNHTLCVLSQTRARRGLKERPCHSLQGNSTHCMAARSDSYANKVGVRWDSWALTDGTRGHSPMAPCAGRRGWPWPWRGTPWPRTLERVAVSEAAPRRRGRTRGRTPAPRQVKGGRRWAQNSRDRGLLITSPRAAKSTQAVVAHHLLATAFDVDLRRRQAWMGNSGRKGDEGLRCGGEMPVRLGGALPPTCEDGVAPVRREHPAEGRGAVAAEERRDRQDLERGGEARGGDRPPRPGEGRRGEGRARVRQGCDT